MPTAAAGLFLIDFFFRPFAKILEKWPPFALIVTLVLYSIVGYIVLKSMYHSPDQQKPY